MPPDSVAVIGTGYRPPEHEAARGGGMASDAASLSRLLAAAAAEALPPGGPSGDSSGLFLGLDSTARGTTPPLGEAQRGPVTLLDADRCPGLLPLRLAWQSVRLGECRAALAAVAGSGAADGGAGAAAVALKRLGDARKDGDRVLAVLPWTSAALEGGSAYDSRPSSPLDGLARIVELLGATGSESLPCSVHAAGADRTSVSVRLEPPGAPRAEGAAGHKVVFAFAGQGHQWLGMGRELLRREPVFREAVERCDAVVRAQVGWSVAEQLALDSAEPRLHRSDVLQPTLFTVQVALAAVWRSWGVEPDAVVGQSMGEVAAAHVAGALSLDDAATIQCRRSALLERISDRGTMAVVELPGDAAAREAEEADGPVSVAGYNSPSTTVLSGDRRALDGLLRSLEARDIYCKQVKDTAPSHSPFVEELRDDLSAVLGGLRPRQAAVPMYSTVTLERVQGPELTAEYWFRNLRRPVRFASVVGSLRRGGHDVFLEISGHPVLDDSIRECLEHAGQSGHVLVSGRRRAELRSMLASREALRSLGRASPAPAPARRRLTPYQRVVAPGLFARRKEARGA
ncbi:acyltransferase domain-containing protein [Streptomyces sulphureus]|uniref:acyltransferase domain-containing protein n=1 Tax=Streptomyces sulphureus TaxID=47758 RepID=UPI001FDF2FC5|nr:acyltransferase domain-containing protein [Streptomyces sulphureus]